MVRRAPPPEQNVGDAIVEFLARDADAPTGRFLWIAVAGPIAVPVPNPGRLRQHDLHHVALGVQPNFKGEIVVSVLELWNRPPTCLIGVLCIGAVVLGLLRWPVRTWRLIERLRPFGVAYRDDPRTLHRLSVGELRSKLGIPPEGLADPFWCSA